MKERTFFEMQVEGSIQRPVLTETMASFREDDEPSILLDQDDEVWSIEKDPRTGEFYKVRL